VKSKLALCTVAVVAMVLITVCVTARAYVCQGCCVICSLSGGYEAISDTGYFCPEGQCCIESCTPVYAWCSTSC